MFFNKCFIHGYLPDKFMHTILTPIYIIKNSKGNITNIDNYRPIEITCVYSKTLELIMIKKLEHQLYTADNQFGFKHKHFTDMAIFALR